MRALDCAAIQSQKLASVRQQPLSLRVMHRRMKFRLTFVAAILLGISATHAHEAIFSWTYTTDLTPKGHGEFEQWITTRWEKEHGSYSVIGIPPGPVGKTCEISVTVSAALLCTP